MPPDRRAIRLRSRAAGFTLVELLIALMLMGLLTIMLLGNLHFGMRAVTAASATLDRSGQIATAEAFLRNTLSDAQSIPDPTAPERGVSIIFDGAPDQIEFATLPPAYLAAGGFHRLTVSLKGEGDERRLIVTWQPIARGLKTTDLQELAPSVLLDKIGAAAFAYCCRESAATEPSDGPPQWTDRWPATDGLPRLIRLHLAFADGRQPPDLLVAPRQAKLPSITK
jgi:general secretion pathway protein J